MLLTLLLACANPTLLTFDPASLELGEVDFAGEVPEDGYASGVVTLTHGGGPDVVVSLPAYETDHLCVAGFPEDQVYPVDLGPFTEGTAYTFTVGVCAYVPGELTTEVTTSFTVETDGDPGEITLPITFTAIRTGE
jgi:hypothetical protein